MHFIVTCCGKDPVLRFAADECSRYLQMANADVSFSMDTCSSESSHPTILCHIGLIQNLIPTAIVPLPDPSLDDRICIESCSESVVIAGINPRSVLIAVYRFLYELGFRWLRPGTDGTFIPESLSTSVISSLHIRETASSRHRGVCIEGASSIENLLDMIDWLPKIGYNSYFLQFEDASVFLNRWYSHINNPYLPDETKSKDRTHDMTAQLIREIKRRGLLLHAMGHGWTTKCMGLQDNGWEKSTADDSINWMLAQVNGKRTLFDGIPTNTNLCYSSPAVQNRFVQTVVEYAADHPNVDYLHVWLADTYNNQCECEKCRTLSPTDWYVTILNQIDRELTRLHLSTRIVVLAYQELLWPPETTNLINSNRFVLMFAPISRSFEKTCRQMGEIPPVPPYRRNRIDLPESLEENTAFLKMWKKQFAGDSFDYDYHLGRAHYGDPGYAKIASVLADDIQYLKELDLNGMILCQEQRISFPTALPNYVGGFLLWNSSLTYEEIASDYYIHCFGESWKDCRRYLETVSAAFNMDFWNGKRYVDTTQVLKNLKSFLHDFPSIADKAIFTSISRDQKCQQISHAILNMHQKYVILFANALYYQLLHQDAEAATAWGAFLDFIRHNEQSLQPYLDVYRIVEIGENYTGFHS